MNSIKDTVYEAVEGLVKEFENRIAAIASFGSLARGRLLNEAILIFS